MLNQLMLGLALAAAQSGGGQAASARTTQAAEAPIVREARAFMENYARVLKAGDRAAIAGLYDRRGAQLQGFAGDRFETHAQITAVYRDKWSPPRNFEWIALRYHPIGAHAVGVLGRFRWTPPQGEPLVASYTGVLVRDGRALRIQIEHESEVPGARPAGG